MTPEVQSTDTIVQDGCWFYATTGAKRGAANALASTVFAFAKMFFASICDVRVCEGYIILDMQIVLKNHYQPKYIPLVEMR